MPRRRSGLLPPGSVEGRFPRTVPNTSIDREGIIYVNHVNWKERKSGERVSHEYMGEPSGQWPGGDPKMG